MIGEQQDAISTMYRSGKRPVADVRRIEHTATNDSECRDDQIMGRKNFFAYVLMMMLLACSGHSANTEDEIRLSDGESSQSFVLPASFKAGQPTESLLRFAVQYPSMSARDWQRAQRNDEIDVWISFANELGRAELLVKRAADKIDTKLPGQFYHDEKEGAFEIYRGMLDRATLVPQVVIYVFRDNEGQLVAVEDPGSWSQAYNVRRKIGSKIQVQYNVAKSLGRNFIEIDKTVKDFILKHEKS